jgi:thioester reductase-like protein
MIMTAARAVLLTGASGVIGSALLPRLAPARVLALVHRNPAPGADETVAGDITSPGLGLDPATYRALARRVDAVVHCAAHTGFAAGRQSTVDVNVTGTREVARFAADAGAVLYYISTAFVARTEPARGYPGRGYPGRDTSGDVAGPEDYLDSKRAAEQVVRDSGVPTMIIRPSIVIGDSRTGRISRFQGLHVISMILLRGMVPLLPIPATSRLDFLPCDVVARAIAELVVSGHRGGEAWLTAGHAAPTAAQVVDLILAVGAELGIRVDRPRMVEPEMVERLIRPVFIDPGPPSLRRRFDQLLALTAMVVDAPVLPTSLGTLPAGVAPLTAAQVADAFRASLHYLAHTRNIAKNIAATPAPTVGIGA